MLITILFRILHLLHHLIIQVLQIIICTLATLIRNFTIDMTVQNIAPMSMAILTTNTIQLTIDYSQYLKKTKKKITLKKSKEIHKLAVN